MTGAPVRPIRIGNRWRDGDANSLQPLHIDFVVAAQQCEIEHRIGVIRCRNVMPGGKQNVCGVDSFVCEIVPADQATPLLQAALAEVAAKCRT